MTSKEDKTLLLTSWKKAIIENENRSWQSKTIEALKVVKDCSNPFTKQLKHDLREEFHAQYEDVIGAEIDSPENRGNKKARDTLDDAQMELHIVRQTKMEIKYDRILANSTRTGDRCNKEFFKYHTRFRRPSPIKELHGGNQILRDQTDLQEYADIFYTNLYTRDNRVEENYESRHECFKSVPELITSAQNKILTRTLEMTEVVEVVKSLSTGKAPVWTGYRRNSSKE